MDFDNISKYLDLEVSNELEIIQGGNSSVIKAQLKDNTLIAIKIYKGEPSRIHRMLFKERNAIRYLTENNFHNIPEILEFRNDLGLIVFRWIEGEPASPNAKSMEAIIDMCVALDNLSKKEFFENAIDAVFTMQDIDFQIIERINAFRRNLTYKFSKKICMLVEEKFQKYKSLFSENQKLFPHTLSISDLGTHNMLHKENSFSFIDFEFFGRDSVDKMVGDFLLHPRNTFQQKEIVKFQENISNELGWQSDNLNFTLPILALKWALIVFKRELKDLELNYSEESINKFLESSIGLKYLEYFEYIVSAEPGNSVSTFNQFSDTI